MRSDLTADRLANAVRMRRSEETIFSFIVEGNLDLKIYPSFFKKDQVHVQPSFGYEKLLDAITILNREKIDSVLGIIDKDFREITNEKIEIDNVFLTDFHDLETMILGSPVLDLFKDVYIQKEDKVKETLNGYSIKEYIFYVARVIASFRYLNYIEKDNFGLRFNDLNYKKMINSPENRIYELIFDHSRNENDKFEMSNYDEIIEEYEKIKVKDFDILQFVNGHDLMHLLLHTTNLVLRKENSDEKFNSVKDLERVLELAYISSHFFYETDMFKEIKNYLDYTGYEHILQ